MKISIPSFRIAAVALVTLFAGIAGCGDNPAQPNEFVTIAAAVHQKINAHRTSMGLPALTSLTVMETQAGIHSANMAAGRTPLDHTGFDARVAEITKTVPLTGAGENVAFNSGFGDPASKAVEDWLNSPGHRTNIEGDFNVTGIAVVRNDKGEYYFTQIFGKR